MLGGRWPDITSRTLKRSTLSHKWFVSGHLLHFKLKRINYSKYICTIFNYMFCKAKMPVGCQHICIVTPKWEKNVINVLFSKVSLFWTNCNILSKRKTNWEARQLDKGTFRSLVSTKYLELCVPISLRLSQSCLASYFKHISSNIMTFVMLYFTIFISSLACPPSMPIYSHILILFTTRINSTNVRWNSSYQLVIAILLKGLPTKV